MDNSDLSPNNQSEHEGEQSNKGPLLLFISSLILVIIAFWQFSGGKTEKRPIELSELTKQPAQVIPEVKPEPEPITPAEPKEDILEAPEPIAPEETAATPEPEVIEPVLPNLDESDAWLQTTLAELTWRKELLKLVIDDDMIRRFVVFTDNFAQGTLAYEHSPFILPKVKFSPDEANVTVEDKENVWQWDVNSTKRFNLYIDLLRSLDSSELVQWYFDIKPLIDEAYSELGYEDDFTFTLQDAITRVLDMELPKSSMELTRPSVMYKFKEQSLEELPDSDKLLLRLGKENLLIIKSILLEINEKLAQQRNGVS
ncbi:DUF3014 domain-containing protein [Litorilituus sediminis]|uniref:DUF3014 domain-containing protein n=1 Tax=Litorilituus sediminis TaxID=718192 RepID=A0A4P6PCP2_9GAMM|nr:DUF3014 domain-containing protein [Litorilituus sediminis]QBG37447.1 DUF3014 domain-containing protein [Litorilituus sediminis]